MKTYPTINKQIIHQPIYAFDKLDGSNIRGEWNKKSGFYKFGSRKRLVGADDKVLGQSRELIVDTYGESLTQVFKDQRWDQAICFFELYGPNSFAGIHDPGDQLEVTLFDIAPHKKGILEPKEFLKLVGHLKHAALLYHGNPNEPFIEQVRNGTLEGMTDEGVVCKGKNLSPGRPLMFKVKAQAWIDKVKARYGDNEKILQDLL